jgi:hypothetical protein
MMERIGSVIAGLIVNFAVIAGIERISNILYPPPPKFDYNDKKQVEAFVKNMSFGGQALVLLGEAAGVLCGSTLASYISGGAYSGLVIGGVTTLGCVANLRMVPGHGPIFSALYLAISLPVSYYGGILGTRLLN